MTDTEKHWCSDYEETDYRSFFWEGKGREYEDLAERIAIRRLLPPPGGRLIEIGAGFGRLVPLYTGHKQVVLFDYSRSGLEDARRQYGDDGFLYVAGYVEHMPFAPGVFDTALMVRVLHHLDDAPGALVAIRQILRQGGAFVLEYSNKRNLKAIARWLLGRQSWNPFAFEPARAHALYYHFHPHYVKKHLLGAGFRPQRTLAVSYFRIALLKRLVPVARLAMLDALLQPLGALIRLTPSVFVRCEAVSSGASAPDGAFWRCPRCGSFELVEAEGEVACRDCSAHYPCRDGIYDFREPA